LKWSFFIKRFCGKGIFFIFCGASGKGLEKKKIQKLQQQKEKGKIRPFKKRCHLLSKNTFEKGIF